MRVVIPLLVLGLLAACRDRSAPAARESAAEGPAVAAGVRADPSCEEAGAREVVERLGERLQRVSLLAPDSVVRREIRSEYAPLATPALLNRWLADPARAPGREVSSPWPARIEVRSVAAEGEGRCRVEGEAVYLTSTEFAGGGAAARVPITAQVLRANGGWRIDAYAAGAPAASRRGSGAIASAPASADTTSPGPAEVVRRYYAAIEARDYRRAYELWGDGGRASGQTYPAFAAGFARTAHVEVEVREPGRVEGAAGSRYVEVPVTVRARTTDGEAQRFEGTYTLQRAVVDGATPAQRRWHLYSAKLTQSR